MNSVVCAVLLPDYGMRTCHKKRDRKNVSTSEWEK